MRNVEKLRRALLVKFGVAPWSEEAKMLTDEMCIEYADFLDTEEAESAAFDEAAYRKAERTEFAARAETAAAPKPDNAAMSAFIERELRCRDTGFTLY